MFATGINARLVQLRKGRSFVAEQGHTVILGWSQRIFPIVSELVIANANHKHSVIAILAERDKVTMEDDIHARIRHPGNTRLVCRTGNPSDLSDLRVVNLRGLQGDHHRRAGDRRPGLRRDQDDPGRDQ